MITTGDKNNEATRQQRYAASFIDSFGAESRNADRQARPKRKLDDVQSSLDASLQQDKSCKLLSKKKNQSDMRVGRLVYDNLDGYSSSKIGRRGGCNRSEVNNRFKLNDSNLMISKSAKSKQSALIDIFSQHSGEVQLGVPLCGKVSQQIENCEEEQESSDLDDTLRVQRKNACLEKSCTAGLSESSKTIRARNEKYITYRSNYTLAIIR